MTWSLGSKYDQVGRIAPELVDHMIPPQPYQITTGSGQPTCTCVLIIVSTNSTPIVTSVNKTAGHSAILVSGELAISFVGAKCTWIHACTGHFQYKTMAWMWICGISPKDVYNICCSPDVFTIPIVWTEDLIPWRWLRVPVDQNPHSLQWTLHNHQCNGCQPWLYLPNWTCPTSYEVGRIMVRWYT